MLTDSEKEWLRRRELYAGTGRDAQYSCMHCEQYVEGRLWRYTLFPCDRAAASNGCPKMQPHPYACLKAAEFEARVAAKLAQRILCSSDERYPCRHGFPKIGCMIERIPSIDSRPHIHCEDCVLMCVRMEVEEEMDNAEI